MATYTPPLKSTKRGERIVEITNVDAGDQLNIVEILGWPASTVQMYTDDAAAQVDYRLNNRTEHRSLSTLPGVGNAIKNAIAGSTLTEIWIPTTTFENTGAAIQLSPGLDVSSLEIVALAGTGPITLIVF